MDTTTHWLANSQLPPQPALARKVHVDVTVIGGGVTGVTAAYLAREEAVSGPAEEPLLRLSVATGRPVHSRRQSTRAAAR